MKWIASLCKAGWHFSSYFCVPFDDHFDNVIIACTDLKLQCIFMFFRNPKSLGVLSQGFLIFFLSLFLQGCCCFFKQDVAFLHIYFVRWVPFRCLNICCLYFVFVFLTLTFVAYTSVFKQDNVLAVRWDFTNLRTRWQTLSGSKGESRRCLEVLEVLVCPNIVLVVERGGRQAPTTVFSVIVWTLRVNVWGHLQVFVFMCTIFVRDSAPL